MTVSVLFLPNKVVASIGHCSGILIAISAILPGFYVHFYDDLYAADPTEGDLSSLQACVYICLYLYFPPIQCWWSAVQWALFPVFVFVFVFILVFVLVLFSI